MDDRIDQLTERVDHLTQRVGSLDKRVDDGFKSVDAAFVEQRRYTEFAYTRLDAKMDAGFSRIGVDLSRIERKLDQFIDVQTKTNALVEERLSARNS